MDLGKGDRIGRGAGRTAPENTLTSFAKTLDTVLLLWYNSIEIEKQGDFEMAKGLGDYD